MRVIITGAHFTPAQAVISELKDIEGVEIVYIGRNRTLEGDKAQSVESQVLPKLGVKFRSLIAGRLQRRFSIHAITSLVKIPIGFIQAFYFLLKDKPDVVLSFGGYIAVPVVIVAWFLSIPIIVHEQTLVVGLANKISNLFACKIAVSFTEHLVEKNPKIILTGNPIRKELLESSSTHSGEMETYVKNQVNSRLPLVLITGGNQGSHTINANVEKIIDELTKLAFVVHQTGDSNYNDFDLLSGYKKHLGFKNRYLIRKWVDAGDWKYLLETADLVISRAGANTLYELAYFGVPVIAIPLPYLYKDEQLANASYFQKQGLVDILAQHDLTPEKLLLRIKENLKNLNNLKDKAKKAKEIVSLGAAKKLALEVLLLGEANVKATKV